MNVNTINNPTYVPGSDAYITEAAANLQADEKKTDSFLEALRAAQEKEDDVELMEACRAFESYFIQLMFKEMRKTVLENNSDLFKKSNGEKIFQDMFDEQVAINSANGGGIGLAAFMYKQMKRENLV